MKQLDNNNHSVFLLTYHLIICVKYRRKAIDEQIATRIKEIGEYVGNNYHITFLAYNHDRDHIHILFKARPNTEISKYINAFKSASSRLIEERISTGSQGAMERDVLVPELLFADHWWSATGNIEEVYRISGEGVKTVADRLSV